MEAQGREVPSAGQARQGLQRAGCTPCGEGGSNGHRRDQAQIPRPDCEGMGAGWGGRRDVFFYGTHLVLESIFPLLLTCEPFTVN